MQLITIHTLENKEATHGPTGRKIILLKNTFLTEITLADISHATMEAQEDH